MANHHWIAGSGSVGCLYDFGPEPCETKESAISALWLVFGDCVSERDSQAMRECLRVDGIYYFQDRQEAGADYCEITRQPGPMPED